MSETQEFKEKPLKRINELRPRLSIDVNRQLKGRNFRSELWAYEGVVGAVLVHVNKINEVPDVVHAHGLTLNYQLIDSGNYDRLIIYILSQLATIDFALENSLALH